MHKCIKSIASACAIVKYADMHKNELNFLRVIVMSTSVLIKNLDYLMHQKRVNATDLQDLINVPQSTTSRILNGSTNNPSDKTLKKYADYFGVDIGELRYKDLTDQKTKIRMAIDDPSSLPPALRDHLTADHGEDELDTDNIEAMLERYVPVISWVAAGDMTPVLSTCLTDVMEWIPRPSHLSKTAFGLVIRGRSMMPEFKPDEIIYVEPEFNPYWLRDGDLVVVSCDGDGEATFKQLVMGETSEDMYLKPLNPEWHNQEIRPMNECRLVGVVDGKYVRYRKHRQWS